MILHFCFLFPQKRKKRQEAAEGAEREREKTSAEETDERRERREERRERTRGGVAAVTEEGVCSKRGSKRKNAEEGWVTVWQG